MQRRFTRDRVETYSDMILGLPGETYDSFVNGIATLIENGQHNRIQFNNLSILPNAEMGDPAYQQRFGMVTVRSEIINIHGQRAALGDDVPEIAGPRYRDRRHARWGLGPHPRNLLDGEFTAFRQAPTDSLHCRQ